MKAILFIILILSASIRLAAQTSFHKYLSAEEKSGTLYRSVKTSDGGYASIGQISHYSSFPVSDLLLVKTDQDGNESWIKQINNSFYDNSFPGITEAENGIVITGTILIGNDYRAFVQKIDLNGATVWTKTFSTNDGISVTGRKIIKDDDDNLFLLGTAGWSALFLLKLDPFGNIVKQHTVDVWNGELPTTFLRNKKGEFFITCQSGGFGNTHIIKLSEHMEVMWRRLLVGGNYIYCNDMKEKADGNIVLTGPSYYYGEPTVAKAFLAEIDPGDGNVIWAKSYSSQYGTNMWSYGLAIDANDQLVVTGRGNASGLLLFGTGDQGHLTWSSTFGTTEGELSPGYGILDDGNGAFVVCGKRWAKDNSVVHMLRFSPAGDGTCYMTEAPSLNEEQVNISTQIPEISATDGFYIIGNDPVDEIAETEFSSWNDVCNVTGILRSQADPGISVHPNPSVGTFTISTGSIGMVKSVKVINTLGYVVFSAASPGKLTSGDIPVSLDLPGGIYIIVVNTADQQLSSRIVIH